MMTNIPMPRRSEVRLQTFHQKHSTPNLLTLSPHPVSPLTFSQSEKPANGPPTSKVLSETHDHGNGSALEQMSIHVACFQNISSYVSQWIHARHKTNLDGSINPLVTSARLSLSLGIGNLLEQNKPESPHRARKHLKVVG